MSICEDLLNQLSHNPNPHVDLDTADIIIISL